MTRTSIAVVPGPMELRPERRWLRLKNIAEVLSVSEGMVRKLIRAGEIRAIYVGRFPRIEQGDLNEFIERRRHAAAVARLRIGETGAR